jgi:membrane-bound lytic murein transglycosylase D
MAKNPKQYGLDKLEPDPAVVSDTVTVDYPIDLRLVADVTNASLQEIVGLNPSLLRMTTPRDMPFDLHIPVGTSSVFAARLKQIPQDKRDTWRFHVVRNGETLSGIAAEFHAHASEIAETNDLAANDDVSAGDQLVIPVATVVASSHPQTYRVRRGDTLVTVADRFGVSVEQLRRWNHLSSNAVASGRSLRVSEPVRLAPRTRSRSRSSHRRGEAHTSSAPTRSRHVVTRSRSSESNTSVHTTARSSRGRAEHRGSGTKRKAAR